MYFPFLLGLVLFAPSSGDSVSGFADNVIYSFANKADTKHFLTLIEPLATYVRDHEQAITFTFRLFVSSDGLSVLILERFIDRAAHDGPHSNSTVHLQFKEKCADWNASTSAITGKFHGDLNESALGTFDRQSPKSIGVSGFTNTVVNTFKDTSSRDHFMTKLLAPFATYVRDHDDQLVYTYRAFLNIDDNVSVLLVERFPSQAAYDRFQNSSMHQRFMNDLISWNNSTHAVTSATVTDWQELSMGVFNRTSGLLSTADSIVV
jgi:quinol monooxygenase YgiN